MTRDKPSNSGSLPIVAAAGLAGMVVGWAMGALSPPVTTATTPGLVDDRELTSLVRSLTDELQALKTSNELMDTNIAQELARLRAALKAPAPTPLLDESAEVVSNNEKPVWATQMMFSLDALKQLQRQALTMNQGRQPVSPDWTIPQGVAIRDYLAALHERASGDDSVTQAHVFWTEAKIQATYGRPDRIEDRGGYIEWIYDLDDEGEQFDFHLVNGLCVMAH
jgi:hypothetical protein